MSDGVLEHVCVFMCVSYTWIGIFPLTPGNTSARSGQWTRVPLENDKVVPRQVSAFINTVAMFVKNAARFAKKWKKKLVSHVILGHELPRVSFSHNYYTYKFPKTLIKGIYNLPTLYFYHTNTFIELVLTTSYEMHKTFSIFLL